MTRLAYESFEEWNPDPSIYVRLFFRWLTRMLNDLQPAAKEIYGHIDNLELHVRIRVRSLSVCLTLL